MPNAPTEASLAIARDHITMHDLMTEEEWLDDVRACALAIDELVREAELRVARKAWDIAECFTDGGGGTALAYAERRDEHLAEIANAQANPEQEKEQP